MQSVGQVIGMTTLNFWTDHAGRKKAPYAIWVAMVASVLTESLAKTWWAWLIAKILAGIGVGGMQVTTQTCLHVPTAHRRATTAGHSTGLHLGIGPYSATWRFVLQKITYISY